MTVDDRLLDKRPGETWLEYQIRLAEIEVGIRDRGAPIVPPEAEQHAEYSYELVNNLEQGTQAYTKRNMTSSPFQDLYNRGTITLEQFDAFLQISMAAETIQKGVSIRTGNLEPFVDSFGSAHDPLIESLRYVRLCVAYTRWRNNLPMPRKMIVEMITDRGPLFVKARKFRMSWPRARKLLIRSLDNWIDFMERVTEEIDERDVEAVYKRLGEGKIR